MAPTGKRTGGATPGRRDVLVGAAALILSGTASVAGRPAAVFLHVPPATDLDHEARDAAIPAVERRRHECPGVGPVHGRGQPGGGEAIGRDRRELIRRVARVGTDADVGPVGGMIAAKGRERSPTGRAGRRRFPSWSLSKLRAQRTRERTIGWQKPAMTHTPA